MTRCRLYPVVGPQEECPEGLCAFWNGGCTIERLGLTIEDTARLGPKLLELRFGLEGVRSVERARVVAATSQMTFPPDLLV